MGKLNIKKTSKEEGTFIIPSNRDKLASASFLNDKKGKKYFVIENKNYSSKSYLKKKVKALIKDEFNNPSFEVVITSLRSGDKLYSDPTTDFNQGQIVTLEPNFNNYYPDGIVECAPERVMHPVKVRFEKNTKTTCRGGGLKNYSLFTLL